MKRNEFVGNSGRWWHKDSLHDRWICNVWLSSLGVCFHNRDVRWFNVFGMAIENVRLNQHGKIIGDE